MKELTHKEWMENTTPRMMWCWNVDVAYKVQAKVIYVLSHDAYPVITVIDNNVGLLKYKHCAEIEEPKTRRMTNKEFSRWLRENPTREYKCRTAEDKDSFVYWYHSYIECCADNKVDDSILIRENDGEWREPLVEVEESKDELKQKEIIKDFTLTAKIEHPKD